MVIIYIIWHHRSVYSADHISKYMTKPTAQPQPSKQTASTCEVWRGSGHVNVTLLTVSLCASCQLCYHYLFFHIHDVTTDCLTWRRRWWGPVPKKLKRILYHYSKKDRTKISNGLRGWWWWLLLLESGLVPWIEDLCAQIYLRSEISVVLITSSSFLFCERKNVLKENKKAVSPDFYL